MFGFCGYGLFHKQHRWDYLLTEIFYHSFDTFASQRVAKSLLPVLLAVGTPGTVVLHTVN